MMKVSRDDDGMLVISQGRTETLVRLLIWIGVVLIFYLVILSDAALTGGPSKWSDGGGWHFWALLLFPVFLLPYLFSLVRGLLRVDELVFDSAAKQLLRRKRSLAAFSDIREIRLQTVHGTCEEFRLSAILNNGRRIELFETEAPAVIESLAAEICDLLGVQLIRTV